MTMGEALEKIWRSHSGVHLREPKSDAQDDPQSAIDNHAGRADEHRLLRSRDVGGRRQEGIAAD